MNKEEYEYVLINATDGIWDVISIDEIKNEIYRWHRENLRFLKDVCYELAQNARSIWLRVRI